MSQHVSADEAERTPEEAPDQASRACGPRT